MVRSMTGFGRASRMGEGFRLEIEIRSVNHRFGEIVIRLPHDRAGLEESLKSTVRSLVSRGRVDANVTVSGGTAAQQGLAIDWELADSYAQAIKQLSERMGIPGELSLKNLLDIPGLIRYGAGQEVRLPIPDGEWDTVLLECFIEALDGLIRMREMEGAFLRKDVSSRLGVLGKHREELALIAPAAVRAQRERQKERLRELLGEIPLDEQRVAMEAAIFAEKTDVSEELTRLGSHFAQFAKLLEEDEPVGRKMDFLIQEMNREVNTIGSKANHAGMAEIVVEMKAELEKIREQVQNIE